jgi:hypothetical protein
MQFEKLDRPGHGSEKSVANAATDTNTIACSRKYTTSQSSTLLPLFCLDTARLSMEIVLRYTDCYLSFVELYH